MIDCTITTQQALIISQKIKNYLKQEKRIKTIDSHHFHLFCNALIKNFQSKVLSYDIQTNCLWIRYAEQGLVNRFDNSNSAKKYSFSDVNNIFNRLNKLNAKIINLDSLKTALLKQPFYIKIIKDKQVSQIVSQSYLHHYWHLSRITSLKQYYNLIDFIKTLPINDLVPLQYLDFNQIRSFLHEIIPDLFILIGEVNHDKYNNLPILVQSQRFAKDNPDDYYKRIISDINDEHWKLSNSLTEVNNFISYYQLKQLYNNNLNNLFYQETLQDPHLGLPKFINKKYKDSQIALVKFKDKEYQLEFIKGNLKNYSLINKEGNNLNEKYY